MRTEHPILTLLLGLSAVVVAIVPGWSELLIFRRADILSGDCWRLFTGHLVHVSGPHLAGNLALIGVAGGLLERRSRRAWRIACGISVLGGGLWLLVFEPELASYAGLSGVAAGLLTVLCLLKLADSPRGPGLSAGSSPWPWLVLLALLMAKIVFEGVDPTPLIVRTGGHRSVPAAHVMGVIAGLLAFGAVRFGGAGRVSLTGPLPAGGSGG